MDQWDCKVKIEINNSLTSSKEVFMEFVTELKDKYEFIFFDEDEINSYSTDNNELTISFLGSFFAVEDFKNKIKAKQVDNLNIEFIGKFEPMGEVRMPLNDKELFNGWLKVYQRGVDNKDYNILKNYSAVTALIVNEDSEVLLVKQFRPSIMTITYELPAGCLDIVDEDPVDTMVRELKEETNLLLGRSRLQKLITYYSALGHSKSENTVYYASVAKSEVDVNNIEDEDVLETIWMPFKQFEKHIKQGNIKDSKTVIAYYHYKTYIEQKTLSIH